MKKIPLSKKYSALVDDADLAWLMQWKWIPKTYPTTDIVYAIRIERDGSRKHTTSMHRQLMGLDTEGVVDHVNGNGLDNQRANLRPCSHSDNMRNRRLGKNNTSGFRGVTWRKVRRLWMAGITYQGKTLFLGYFEQKEDAARAYDNRATELFGNFARLNFP